MKSTRRKKVKVKQPRVGAVVEVAVGGGFWRTGTVVEDRGPIGVGGRRLFRVRVQLDPKGEPIYYEAPLDELRLVKEVA